MSPHVVPKVHPFSDADEDEKTTIESGWEDEASTTVEQGDVQDKIRAIASEPPRRPITGITSTNAGQLDELTVDDQRQNVALLPAPPPQQARLMITAGNDTGQEIEIRPGKSYTIGRAIDNDLVLTDIAVSRKHFDIVSESAEGWLVVDRGSGNGTVVNGNIEDQPFVLNHGDMIEIGNTVFRFEAPNAPPLPARPGFEVDIDEEPSTVAGKQPNALARDHDESATPSQLQPMQPMQPTFPPRPKTQPPPPPLRQRTSSGPPYQASQPMAGLPLPLGRSQSQPPALHEAQAPMLPTTLPGQAMPAPNQQQMLQHLVQSNANLRPLTPPQLQQQYPQYAQQHPQSQQMPFGYPGLGDMSNPRLVVGNGMLGRDATATSLVPPTPYSGVPVAAPPATHGLTFQLSLRAKLIAGGAALALIAAAVTLAIVKGNARPTEPEISPIEGSATGSAIAAEAPRPDVKPEPAPPTKIDPKVDPKIDPKVDPKISVAPGRHPDTVEPPKLESPRHPDVAEPPKKIEPPKTPVRMVEAPRKIEPPKTPPKHPDLVEAPKKVEPLKVEPKKPAVAARTDGPHTDLGPVKAKASEQFRAKNFAAAATTLRAAIQNAGASEAKELKSLASGYEQFGKLYNTGMAPAASATVAYQALKSAKNYDSEGAFLAEIKPKLAEVAGKAAGLYTIHNEYESAYLALTDAEAFGGVTSNTTFVRKTLEGKANDLYNQANKEMAADPEGAKTKLNQVLKMVSPKAPIAAKAKKLLSGG